MTASSWEIGTLPWWKRTAIGASPRDVSVGLSVGAQNATVVAFDGEVEGKPSVLAWESIPCTSPIELQAPLRAFVDQNGLDGHRCRAALASADYSLRLVERPENIPDEELADATRWLIRDLVEFDIETATLATITLPEDEVRARTPRMFVIAANQEPTVDLARVIEASGLELDGFEVAESAILALEARMPDLVAGGAALSLADKSSILTLSHDQQLYLVRNLHVDLDALDQAADRALNEEDPAGPAIIQSLDALLLDLQRSFDYYESEYGKAPASRLTLLPGPVDLTPLIPALSEALRPVQIETFELTHYFDFPGPPPPEMHPSLGLAIGSAFALPELLGNTLLPASLRRKASGFGLASVARLSAALALFLGLYSAIALYSLDQKQDTLSQLELNRETLADALDTRLEEAGLNASKADPELELAELTTRRDAGVSMLRDMTKRNARSDTAFSALLTGLARQDTSGLWLERIEFSEGGDSIALEGRTLSADNVPIYLKQLGAQPGFDDRTFKRFELERTDASESGLAFRIASQASNDPGDEERP